MSRPKMTREERRAAERERATHMFALYCAGKTMKEVGERFGCSKQRVGQILRRRERAAA